MNKKEALVLFNLVDGLAYEKYRKNNKLVFHVELLHSRSKWKVSIAAVHCQGRNPEPVYQAQYSGEDTDTSCPIFVKSRARFLSRVDEILSL